MKLVVIIAAHAAVCTAIAVGIIQNAHFQNARSVFGAQYYFGVFLIPNILSFAISAWIIRARWAGLRLIQVVAAGLSLGLLTVITMLIAISLVVPFLGIPIVSEVVLRATMVVPGIIAAQFLRIHPKRRVQPSAP